MRRDARRTLVAYDVSDDKRRVRLAKVLEAYGRRLQYSVFIIEIGPIKTARLRRELLSVMQPDDSVILCDLGRAGASNRRVEFLGRRGPAADGVDFVL